METLLIALGRLAGLAGAVLCMVAGVARLTGRTGSAAFS